MLGEGKVIQALIGVIVEISPYRSLTVRRGFERYGLITSLFSLATLALPSLSCP